MIERSGRATATTIARTMTGLAARQALPLALAGLLLWTFRDRLALSELAHALRAVTQIGPGQWLLALGATALSFLAIGRYDAIWHDQLETGVRPPQSRLSGMAAVGIAQFAGLGLLTGTLARWRLVPDLTLRDAARLTAAVSASFLAGWAVVSSAFLLVLGGADFVPRFLCLAILLVAAAVLALPLALRDRPRWLPASARMGRIAGAVALDLGFAGLAFLALLPPGSGVPAGEVVTAVALAMMAGLVLATPGGIGPFELALVAALPAVPQPEILASAMAFRLVYHALPGCLGAIALVTGIPAMAAGRANGLVPHASPRGREMALWGAPFAEALLARHGPFDVRCAGGSCALLARPGQSQVLFRGPLQGDIRELAGPMLAETRALGRHAIAYKLPARQAAALRGQGWQVLRIAQEAVIDPATHGLEGPARRQLRRMLRKAEDAGVRPLAIDHDANAKALAQVAARWARAHGGEKGFSMGAHDPDLLREQRLFAAFHGGRLVAFVSFHANGRQWALDLMRHDDTAPAGTMHALVHHAIEAAAAQGVGQLSLAAAFAPDPGALARLPAPIRRRVDSRTAPGLARFKQCFAPRWLPLYAAAPSRAALIVGLWDIYRAVHAGCGPAPHRAADGKLEQGS